MSRVKTLIAYSSTYGAAADCAQQLAQRLGAETDVVDLANAQPDPAPYDRVIIGGSIYMGQIQKSTKAYCQTYGEQLLQKPLGLYVCSGRQDDDAAKQLQEAFPAALREHALWMNTLGYRYKLQGMNFLHRFIIKKVAKVSADEDRLNSEAMDALAAAMNAG